MTTRDATTELDTSGAVEDVFSDLVRAAMEGSAMDASSWTERYLTCLLLDFLRCQPQRLDQTFAYAWLEASTLGPVERYRRLKEIGDTTLFLAGVFADWVDSTATGCGYYVELGRSAYLGLGARRPAGERQESGLAAELDVFARTYRELGERFEDYAAVLGVVADRHLFASETRVVELYRRWLESGSPRIARRLQRIGVAAAATGPSRTPN